MIEGLIIPENYKSSLNLYDTQASISFIKKHFEDKLSTALNLKRVSAPLFVEKSSGLNDDLDGKAGFTISLDNMNDFSNKLDYLASLNENEYSGLINSTKKYFIDKMSRDNAIAEHKKMFNAIIKEFEK